MDKQIDLNRNIFDTNNALLRNITRNEAYFDSENILHKRYLPFKDVEGKNGQYEQYQESTKLIDARLNPYISNKVYKIWNEGDAKQIPDTVSVYNGQNEYSGFRSSDKKDGLLEKTNILFQSHNENGIDTLIGRFHTTGGRDRTHNEVNLLQTAVSVFGMSHGRNLLNKKAYENGLSEKENGYSNPYCRTWTYHKQYKNIDDLIRPFKGEYAEIEKLQQKWDLFGRRKGSSDSLKTYSTLNRNGFVNITPTEEHIKNESFNVDVRKCMFSIENLAWKDVTEGGDKKILSKEQTGPNGGRIMWFPPYDLNFNEVVNVDWNSNDFIGRGEKIYTYKNTDRSGTLSFTLLVDHPSILDMWKKNGASLDEDKNEQQLLRFFAGCDTLSLDNTPLAPIENNTTPKPDDEPIQIPVIVEDKPLNDIIFYIFYPNNYSGVDNFNEAIEYLANTYESTGTTGSVSYKVDNSLKNEKLLESNKVDANNFKLNYDLNVVKSVSTFTDATVSFFDMVNNFNNNIKDKTTIIGVDIESYASSHGYDKNNKELCKHRSETAKKFIEINGITNINIKEFENKNIQKVDDIDKNNVSGESAKRSRHTKVIIRRKKILQISDLSDISSTYVNNNLDDPIVVDSISVKYNRTTESSGNGKLTKKQKRAIKKIKKNHEKRFNEWANDSERILNNVSEQLKTIKTDTNVQNTLNKLQESLPKSRIIDGSLKTIKENEYNDFVENHETRWENEAQYFSMLKENDTFLYTRLVDKIKYFTPAFHSITPEGFNSRLSFLHQCTRQGLTMSVSDSYDTNDKSYKSAGNLAFGRPPICVLRIGDFFHTRIIIDSVSINYENTTWDMNPEGIGVQPMFAKISLNFKFLGGSDLGAPISRLQNALSFNYYANQSIYDDRSDLGIYENKKAKIKGKPWMPNKQ